MSTIKSNVQARFGLAGFPVNISTAIKDVKEETGFNTVCIGTTEEPHAATRVSQQYKCGHCATTGRGTDFVKGRDLGDGRFALVTAEDLKAADVDDSLKNQLNFTVHPAEEVAGSTMPTGRVYYLEPGKGCPPDAYATIAEAVENNPDKAIMTVWAARSAPALYRAVCREGILMLVQYAWPAQLDATPNVPHIDVTNQQRAQLALFLDTISAPFDPNTYVDVRAEALQRIIAATSTVEALESGRPAPVAAPAPVSFMDTLLASVPQQAPAKKAAKAAKKAAPRKAAAKAS